MYLLDEKKEQVVKEFAERCPEVYDMLVEVLNYLTLEEIEKFVEVVQYEVEREKMKR